MRSGMTVWSSLRAAVSASTDSIGRFLLVNLAWLATAALTVTAGASFRPAYVLTLLVVPVTCGLVRMAAHAARGDLPRLRHFRDGVRHRCWTHVAIGAGQCLLLAVAAFNIGIGMAGDSLLFALVTVVAGYIALGTVLLAVAVWPLLLDPQRTDVPVTALFRLAFAVITTRPIGLLVIAVIEAALLAAITEVALLGIVLPSFGALIATSFVLPAADGLQIDGRDAAPPRSASDHG
jgi:hypothetical protein